MYNSMLDLINAVSKNKELLIDGAYINFSDKFPQTFYDTVIKYMKEARDSYIDNPKINGFYVRFDEAHGAYLEFIGNENTKVVILKEGRYYPNLPSAKIIKEQFFLESIDKLDTERNLKILESLPVDFKTRFIKDSKQIQNINDIFSLIGFDISNYIIYLNEEYKEIKKEEMELQRKRNTIYFNEAPSSSNLSPTAKNNPSFALERKNAELTIEERLDILNNLNPTKEFEAISNNSNSVYYVKVFKVNDRYKLVMEPEEGTKYTKVVYIDKERLEDKELKTIVIDTLQLSRDDTTKQKNITRHSHTTLEEYRKLLRYLICQEKEGLNHSVIKKINEAENYKKR